MKKIYILFFLLYQLTWFTSSQTISGKGTISGKVFDYSSKAPVEYANILLMSTKDSLMIDGTVTNKDGYFNLSGVTYGSYIINIQFVGFARKTLNNITISSSKNKLELGNIFIKSSAVNLQDVVVQGERSPVTYQIDKKVIDVTQMQTAISGNAADVLENVPSITVDIEGNVSLRGSSNFSVLIDGRPSVMDAQDALQQIPASTIQNIEIITNPSAKYDPEGNAGIINIILKKNKNIGLSGIANLNAGVNNKYGGDFLFEHKTSLFNYNFGMDYNKRNFPGARSEEKQFDYIDNTSYVNSNGSRERGRKSFGIRGGIDFNFNEIDRLSLGGRFGSRNNIDNTVLNYIEWSVKNPQNYFYLGRNESQRTGNFFAIHSDYLHKFTPAGHELSGEFFIGHNSSDESNLTSEMHDLQVFNGKKTTESGPSYRIRAKVDYTLPLAEKRKFEAGSQGEMELSKDITKMYDYNIQTETYDFQTNFSNSIDYNISELAIYSIYSDTWGNLGLQGGIRTEYTFRSIHLIENPESFSIDRWDFFPSVHTSYKFSEETQMMLSYTRRIDRPHGWNLEPFYTWTDANNIRIGNPSLQPELIDSYDYGFQTYFWGVSFTNDLYYRINHNKIEYIRSVYSENVTLTTFDNVGNDYSLGSEFMITYNPFRFWDLNLMGNLYNYKIDGLINNESFAKESFNWSTRISNNLKITASTALQLNVRYNSPTISSQGRREGFFMTDVAIKQDFFNKNLSITLQIRDLLKTGKYELYSTGTDFSSHLSFTRQSPVVMLNVKYNFNNYKKENGQINDQQDNGSGEEI